MPRVLILIIGFLSVTLTWAGNGTDVRYRNFTMADGLPAYGVRTILQDADGFIWFGTDNGLCRYDGTYIKPFRIEENAEDQYVSRLALSDDGILVGTNSGLFLFDTHKEHFERIVPQLTSIVSDISTDRDGNLWAASLNDGVYCHNIRTQHTRHFPFQSQGGRVNCVYVDNDNQVWALLTTSPCVWKFNKATEKFQPLQLKNEDDLGNSTTMLQTRDGHIYIGTWGQGIYRLDDDRSLSLLLNPAESGVGSQTSDMLELPATGEILVACGDGLLAIAPQTRKWRHVAMTDNPYSVNSRFAYSAILDQEGGIWVSTFYGGVNYISPVAERFESYTPAPGGLQGSVVEHFCEDARGHIWMGTDDGGLNCYDPATRQFIDYPHRDLFSRLNIHSLCIDGEDLWIGTYANGIYRMNLQTESVRAFNSNDGLTDNSGYAIYVDDSRRVWVGTLGGACVFNRQTERFTSLQYFESIAIDILSDGKGNIWYATQVHGLWRYNIRTGRWKQFSHTQAGCALPTDEINSLCLDAQGQLLVATANGLFRYHADRENFTPIVLPVRNERICCLIPYGNDLWLSTGGGLVKWMGGDSVQLFNRFDGLVGDQFLPNSGLISSDGHLYFGSIYGFSRFLPYHIELNRLRPHVFITQLAINNKPVDVGCSQLPEALSSIRQLSLGYSENNLSLGFTSLSYCSPEKNQYAYKLEGFDDEWTYAGPRHTANYTNIPAGTYTFRVRATNNDGIWSTDEATLRIVVHPPFWWSLPARILYLLLAVLAIWYYTHWRLRRVRRQHREELRQMEEQRKAEEERQRLNFFTTVAHEIRTPVSLIIGPLEHVIQRVQPTPANRLVGNDLGIIQRNAARLLELVNQLLDFSKVQGTDLHLRLSLTDVCQLTCSVADRFRPSFQKRHIDFRVTTSEPPVEAVVDSEGITKVLSNLLSNALKYARDRVTVSCTSQPDSQTFTLTVEDNGPGISDAEQKKIFQPFYQAEHNKPGTGIGLSIVQNIVLLHHGTTTVESQSGQGTRFVVTLPLRADGTTDSTTATEAPVEGTVSDATAASIPATDDSAADAALAAQFAVTPCVLIVEDNEDMRGFLADNFRRHFSILLAENGQEALRQLADHNVTLIVSDWMMPGMDGAELCRRVRADRATSHIPFIMLTAKTDNQSKVEGMNIGADAYIEKPFSVQYLDACIRRLIESRRQLMQRFSTHPSLPVSTIAPTPVDNELLTRMETIIEQNMANPQLSVNLLAEKLEISRSTLFNKIKSLTEQTPNEIIQVIRLRRAAQLISTGNSRIAEVSAAVGFNSSSYFAKCFQKQFGCRPTDYVKHLCPADGKTSSSDRHTADNL